MLKGADMAPVDLVGVGVEVVVAEACQAGEHLVDLGLFADERIESRLPVPGSLLGAQLVAGRCLGFRRVIVAAPL